MRAFAKEGFHPFIMGEKGEYGVGQYYAVRTGIPTYMTKNRETVFLMYQPYHETSPMKFTENLLSGRKMSRVGGSFFFSPVDFRQNGEKPSFFLRVSYRIRKISE